MLDLDLIKSLRKRTARRHELPGICRSRKRQSALQVERLEDRRLLSYGLGANLVVNGGAESGFVGWTTNGYPTVEEYGTKTGFPSKGEVPDGGQHFFWGGPGGQEDGVISQAIDLAGGAGSIDVGVIYADFSAYLGGYAEQEDHSLLSVHWLDSGGNTIRADPLRTVTASDRGGSTGLEYRALRDIPVPKETRSARLVLLMDYIDGGRNNDASADRITLVLRQESLTLSPGTNQLNDIVIPPGELAVNVDAGTATWSGDVTGTGDLLKGGAGNLNITGTFKAGRLIVNGGSVRLGDGNHKADSLQINSGSKFEISPLASLAISTALAVDSGAELNTGSGAVVKARTVSIKPDATLSGTGALAIGSPIDVEGTADPGHSAGRLTTSSIVFHPGSKLRIELDGSSAGSGYDQLRVNGSVTLDGATLYATRLSTFNPSPGQGFWIIDNDGTDAVVGTFANLPEGKALSVGGKRFHITYKGGDGNDVGLIRNKAPSGANTTRSVNEDTTLSNSVSRSDPNGDEVTVQLVSGTSHSSSFTLNTNGSFSYRGAAHFSGADSFTYRVSDKELSSSTYTVKIDVAPVADAPTLTVQNASGNESSPIPLNISSGLVDRDGSETLSLRISGIPAGVVLNKGTNLGGGVWSLTPTQLSGLTIESPDNQSFTLTVAATAKETGNNHTATTSKALGVTVGNLPPTLATVADQAVAEGAILALTDIGHFTDPGFVNAAAGTDETFTYSINWGDGTTADTGTATVDSAGTFSSVTQGSFDGSHIYADDGIYTVTVRVADDDTSGNFSGTPATDFVEQTFQVTVSNVNPTLVVVADQTITEGALLSLPDLGTLTDPGFHNPLNPNGPSLETFAYSVDWGDGTSPDSDSATVDSVGAVNDPTDASFDGSHIYADNGTYTVTVRVVDDDMSGDFSGTAGVDFVEQTFQVTVSNVNSALAVVGAQSIDEGALLNLTNLGTLTDPGFHNPLNPNGPSLETFTYSVDWGDGTSPDSGSAKIDSIGAVDDPTDASFDGSHIYADNGTYTVTVRVADDDLSGDFSGTADVDFVEQTFQVTVSNVAPSVGFTGSALNVDADNAPVPFSGVRGQTLFFDGAFSDPGFDNPNNAPNAASVETFTYAINWGDMNATDDVGSAAVDQAGSRGVPTTGSFGGSHIYTEEGIYTVAVTVTDDDGAATTITRLVTVEIASVQVGGELAVGGTIGPDEIQFRPGGNPGDVEVRLGGVVEGAYQPSGRLLAFGQAGDDDMQVAGSISLAAWLYGDTGDDRLKGGAGNDVLMGGLGADLLIGQSGRDLMIGGRDADRMIGNSDDDILVAGYTAFGYDYGYRYASRPEGVLRRMHDEATSALMAEWTSQRDYLLRVENISGMETGQSRENGNFFLRTQDDSATEADERTVFGDGARDFLTGSQGDDWFFFNPEEDNDKATDLRDEVFANDLGWIDGA